MIDSNNAAINRRQLLEAAGAAATAAAVIGLTRKAEAAQPLTLVPLKMTAEFPLPQPRFTIPVNPPIVVGINSASGVDPVVGAFTYIEHTIAHLDTNGNPLSVTDGIAAMTMANGDALFTSWSGRYVPPTAPYDVAIEGIFTVTGGQGHFLGATGSGAMHVARDSSRQVIVCTMDGMVSAPK